MPRTSDRAADPQPSPPSRSRTPLVVVVAGGRDYEHRAHVRRVLDLLDVERGPLEVHEGGCPTGADFHARAWRHMNCRGGLSWTVEPSEWRELGRAAGPRRNARMLFEARPALVVAFPGGDGTADLVRRARELDIEVHRQRPRDPCEWDTVAGRAACEHQVHADAEVIVGANGEWRLCRACAALPRFSRYRRRVPIQRPAPREVAP